MSTTGLKLLALGLMFLDHMAEFLPGMPVWMHWLGRLSAPLFLFCMVWGFHYTHNRHRYLFRMYLFGCAMAVLDVLCNTLVNPRVNSATNDIFVMLLLVGILCTIVEEIKAAETRRRGWGHLALFCVGQVASTALCLCTPRLSGGQISLAESALLLGAVLPNIVLCEGSVFFVGLGVGLYFLKEHPARMAVFYLAMSGLFLWPALLSGEALATLLQQDYQWMMAGALPLMLCYNGKKGPGLKYLFYVFYPAHVVALFLLGNWMAARMG